ncbi:diaminobutyrate--2-oxoglutarate transaminase [Pseudomonas putida]|uniref:diaminobutyrate--2-oxoglutarate transaminase n=1 Tax=Pseudomonas putida TaxID=303 RepID=UPI002DBDBAAB|nr:diaminobutyrate--2-oxoglutarate transaminase [Pseudomonas putida]WRW01725.1 diaminobutyrate--2-oxoglutarate transaminase [Pseudomonas putida]
MDKIEQFADAAFTLEHFRRQPPRTLESNAYLERQSERESSARSYPRRIPLALVEAHGLYVRDSQGQFFMDCLGGAGTLALGHNHPVTVAAMRQTLDSGLPLHTLDLTTPVKEAFVDELFDCLPPAFARQARVQFCGPTGADAIEAALKLAKIATGRKGVFTFSGGYHGMTQGALSLMGNLGPKNLPGSLMADVQVLPYPYDYRCPFGLGGEAGIDAGLSHIEHLLTDPESGVLPPAALVVEVVQGEGGVIPAPARWLQGLRRLTREYGIVLVIDEVQTGFGRTGDLFAFESAGIEPDVLVLSKALGGGLPLSVIVYRDEFDGWKPGAHAGTFRGNQMAMAAGTATLRYLRSQGVAAHARLMGERLMAHLRELQGQFSCIGQVRGRGLMIGVEIVAASSNNPRTPAGDGAMARAIQQQCLREGVILELGGRHGAVVRFLPPLIIQPGEIDLLAEKFERALVSALALPNTSG